MLVVIQLAKLFGYAAIITFFAHSIGYPPLPSFLLAVLVQYGAYNAYAYCVRVYGALKNKELETQRLKAIAPQGLEVACPCYKKYREFIPIKLTNNNYYKCTECNKTLNAIVSCETVLVTEPIVNTELEANINI